MYPTCTHPQRHGVLGHAAAGNGGSVKLHRKWHPSLSSHTTLYSVHMQLPRTVHGWIFSPVRVTHVKCANGNLSFVKSPLTMTTSMDFARGWQATVLSTPCNNRSNCSRWSVMSPRLAKLIKALMWRSEEPGYEATCVLVVYTILSMLAHDFAKYPSVQVLVFR